MPHDNVIVFDGVCNLCNSSVAFVVRHDKKEAFRFVHIQSNLGRSLCRQAGLNPEELETFMVVSEGRHLVRSDAALQIFQEFGGLWRLLMLFKFVPKPWRDAVYSFLANRRYRWFGRRDACLVPTGDLGKRFLN